MLKDTPKTCLKGFSFICAFALTSSLFAAKKEEPIDLSILQQRDVIARTLNPTERVNLLKIESRVEKAKSDIQSAKYLVNTKPTAFRGEKKVQEIVKNGEAQLKTASEELEVAQKKLVDYLTTARAKFQEQQSTASKKYGFTLESSGYANALEVSIKMLLQKARNKGFKTVLYDTGFVTNLDGTTAFQTSIQNATYDMLVEIDGINYTLKTAFGLKLGEEGQLTFENQESFGNDKLALLAVEFVQANESDGHLVTRLIDIKNYQLVGIEVLKVTEVPQLIEVIEMTEVVVEADQESSVEESEEASEEESEIAEEEVPEPLPLVVGADITDKGMWIDRLATQNYNFKIVTNSDAPIVPTLLMLKTVAQNSSMSLIDIDFLNRAYGTEELKANALIGAELTLDPEEDNAFTLSAKSYSNNRVLEIGTVQLNYE